MKYKWLNKNNNDKLIIFFNGWGMDEGVVEHLDFESFDVVMFYDYNNLDTDFCLDKEYQKINVIAWSMGVLVSGIVLKNICKAANIVVINGTLKPVDEKYGIHPKIYDLTIKGFNEAGRNKFIKNMFIGKIRDFKITRTLENQKSELIALKNYHFDGTYEPTKIIISDSDKIIPTQNQSEFWGVEPNFKGGHCIFFEFKKWSELL